MIQAARHLPVIFVEVLVNDAEYPKIALPPGVRMSMLLTNMWPRTALALAFYTVVAGGTGCTRERASVQQGPNTSTAPTLSGDSTAPPLHTDDPAEAAAKSMANKSAAELSAADPPSAASHTAASQFLGKIIRGERHEAYNSLHSTARATFSEAQFIASLDLMDSMYGKVLMAEGKREFIGVQKSTQFGTLSVRTLTYSVTTTKYPKGTHFASVDLVTDGDHVAPQRYQVFTFMGEIPPDLR